MFRYWIYLSFLVPICTLLPSFAYLEPGGSDSLQGVISGSEGYGGLVSFLLRHTAPIGFMVGVLVALWVATLDKVKHGGHNARYGALRKRLVLNLAWCSLYTLPFLLVDIFLVQSLWRYFPVNSTLGYYVLIYGPMVFVGIVNASGVLWGALRTANTSNVMTPRALWHVLHRSARPESF